MQSSNTVNKNTGSKKRVGISGPPGSGKTTVARLLSERKKMEFFSMGMLFRDVAKSRNLTISELSTLAERDRSIDELIDSRQIELLKSENIVMDSRLSCWLMSKNSIPGLKVWITAPFEVRAERIAGREKTNIESIKELLELRERSEAERYKRYYAIDIKDLAIYDVIINNSALSAEECCDVLLAVMDCL